MAESWMTEKEVAKLLNVSLACLRRWRLEGRGPKFRKFGSLVRYRGEDVEAWTSEQPVGGGAGHR